MPRFDYTEYFQYKHKNGHQKHYVEDEDLTNAVTVFLEWTKSYDLLFTGQLKSSYDYVNFSFIHEADRHFFFERIECLLKVGIPRHSMNHYKQIEPKPILGSLYALLETNGKAYDSEQRRYHLSFPGKGCQEVYRLLFHPLLIYFPMNDLVVLRRVDFCIDTRSGADKNTISQSFTFFQGKQVLIEKEHRFPRSISVQDDPKRGNLCYIKPEKSPYVIRVYTTLEESEKVRFEMEINQSNLNRANMCWAKQKPKDLFIEILNLVLKHLIKVAICPLTQDLHTRGKKQIEKILTNFSQATVKNLIKASVPTIEIKDEKSQTIMLQNHEGYPCYLAIFRKSFAVMHDRNLILPTKKTLPSEMLLKFSILELLNVIGWPNTRHYQRKFISQIISLEKISITVENKNKRIFCPLIKISVINKKEGLIELKLDLFVFKSLWDTIPMHETFYKESVENYLNFFGKSENKEMIPSFLYSLLSQSYASTYEPIIYDGYFPKNVKSAKHVLQVLTWIFEIDYVTRKFISTKGVISLKTNKKIIYKSGQGSFEINTERDRKPKKNDKKSI